MVGSINICFVALRETTITDQAMRDSLPPPQSDVDPFIFLQSHDLLYNSNNSNHRSCL